MPLLGAVVKENAHSEWASQREAAERRGCGLQISARPAPARASHGNAK